MGGNKTYSIQKVTHGGMVSGGFVSKNEVYQKVSSGIPNEIISSTLGAICSYEPTISALTYGLKFAELAFKMYKKYQETYDRTGDVNESIESVAEMMIKKAVDTVKKEGIRLAVSTLVNQSNIKIEDSTKNTLVDSVSNTLEDLIK